jgi:hypothetical protein
MLVASRQGRDVPRLARVMLLAGIGATIAANVGYGLHAGITGRCCRCGRWPPMSAALRIGQGKAQQVQAHLARAN